MKNDMWLYYLAIFSTVLIIILTITALLYYNYKTLQIRTDFDSKFLNSTKSVVQSEVNNAYIQSTQQQYATSQSNAINQLEKAHHVNMNAMTSNITYMTAAIDEESSLGTSLYNWENTRINALQKTFNSNTSQLMTLSNKITSAMDDVNQLELLHAPSDLLGQYNDTNNSFMLLNNSTDLLQQNNQYNTRIMNQFMTDTKNTMDSDYASLDSVIQYGNSIDSTYTNLSTYSNFVRSVDYHLGQVGNYADMSALQSFATHSDVQSLLGPYVTTASLNGYAGSNALKDYVQTDALDAGYATYDQLHQIVSKDYLNNLFNVANNSINNINDFLIKLPQEFTTQQDIMTLFNVVNMINATMISLQGQCQFITNNYATNATFNAYNSKTQSAIDVLNNNIIPNLNHTISQLSGQVSLLNATYMTLENSPIFAKIKDFNPLQSNINSLPTTPQTYTALFNKYYGTIPDFKEAQSKFYDLPNFDARYGTYADLDGLHTEVQTLRNTGDAVMKTLSGKNLNGTYEFGMGINGKDKDAGKIGYQFLSTNGLDIVGAGQTAGSRYVQMWDNVTVNGTLHASSLSLGGDTNSFVPLGPFGPKGNQGGQGDPGGKGPDGPTGCNSLANVPDFTMAKLNNSTINTTGGIVTSGLWAYTLCMTDNAGQVCINPADLHNFLLSQTKSDIAPMYGWRNNVWQRIN